jgi:hypothetical protein
MSKLFQSKKWVGVLLAVVILGICLTFTMRQVWWCFIDIFFFFMAAFLQLMSLILAKASVKAAAKLQMIALVCLILAVLALVGEAIALLCVM